MEPLLHFIAAFAILRVTLDFSAASTNVKLYRGALYSSLVNASMTNVFSFGNKSTQGVLRLNGITKTEFGTACLSNFESRQCRSFSFAENESLQINGLQMGEGNCEVVFGAQWMNYSWPSDPPDVVRRFYLDASLMPTASTFKIIPAITDGPTGENMAWANDCMNQVDLGGFMVAIRNNLTTSGTVTDFKCRIFSSGVSLVRNPATVVFYADNNANIMACPQNQVVTAKYSDGDYDQITHIRCNALNPPWAVDTSISCRVIQVYKVNASSLPLSPMNDLNLTGTAESIWGAQCGTQTVLEAMVLYDIAQGATFPLLSVENFVCCRIIQA